MGKVKSVIQRNKPEPRTIGRKTLKESIDDFLKRPYKKAEFSTLVDAINSNDLRLQYFGIIGLRKLFSPGSSRNSPKLFPLEDITLIREIIDSSIIQKLINFLKNNEEPHLQVSNPYINKVL